MKKTFLALFAIIALNSCKKTYVCECTDKTTGEKSYGDHFRADPLTKKSAQIACDDMTNELDTTSTCKLIKE